MYRYFALLDRLEGKDANDILQSYTDMPGRPTSSTIARRRTQKSGPAS